MLFGCVVAVVDVSRRLMFGGEADVEVEVKSRKRVAGADKHDLRQTRWSTTLLEESLNASACDQNPQVSK